MVNIEGPVHELLADSNKHQCEFCGGSKFYIGVPATDENTDFPSWTKAYLWENSAPTLPYGNMCTVPILCVGCGEISGLLAFGFDVCSACATPAVTATHIAGVVANGLAGLYLTPLGAATDAGVSFLINSNTLADPTVITLNSAINNDAAADPFLISSWKVF